LDPLNITFVFSYSSIDDTSGIAQEWDVINGVNQRTFQFGEGLPLLDILGVVSPVPFHYLLESEFTPRVYSHYNVPVYREHPGYGEPHNVYEAYELIQGVLDEDTTGIAPSNMSIYPAGVYICLASDLAE
ncbi:MAG TPA: hypothetical protein VM118_12060, partial [Acidobacteriota bacterium]|nr:hypothetical protein [Acidobacteriota bacterium]